MKKLIFGCGAGIFFFFSPAVLSSVHAQSGCSGVYLSADDLAAGRLISCVKPHRSDNVMNSKYFFIQQNGAVKKLGRKDLYAVKYCDGRVFRVFGDGFFAWLNPGEAIPLYEVVENPVAKGNICRTEYYFSKDARSAIQQLTRDNVKAAFAGDAKFEEALDLQFGSDRDLYAYDSYNKCYRLDRVYAICK
ncbi:MAG TPA: hypothetical protein VKQ52_03660 [Puia sp.]|nr:hypothetical protein [Puia sp.]